MELSEAEFLRVMDLMNREVALVEATGRLTPLLAALVLAAPRVVKALRLYGV